MGAEVDNQVAAPAETRTPSLHRAIIAQQKSADGRMATEAARLKRKKKPQGGKTKADLTHTGLLMEGLILSGRVPTQLETQHYWGPLWAPNLFSGEVFPPPKANPVDKGGN